MARGQGRRFLEVEIARIRHFLAVTDMSIPEIAARMNCSSSSVVAINQRFAIRHYNGRRSQWQIGSSPNAEAVVHV